MNAALIIPALNEEQSIGRVLDEIPAGLYSMVFVVDNGSIDRTAEVAEAHGARVLVEPRRGYGNACLRAMAELSPRTHIVIFMDGDGSDVAAEARRLIDPIARGEADFVLGSRELGDAEPGALSPHQRFGNRVATSLIRLSTRVPVHRLGTIPGNPRFEPRLARHAGPQLRLDRRDANQGRSRRGCVLWRFPSPIAGGSRGRARCRDRFGAVSARASRFCGRWPS